jgi:cytochrome P450
MRVRERIDDVASAIELGFLLGIEKIETGLVFLPMRAEMRRDPYPFYRRLRERDPVHRSRAADGWVLSRHADVLAVLSDRRFSADERNLRRYPRLNARQQRAGLPDFYEEGFGSMLRLDPPDHTRLRSLVSKAFTSRAVERMRGRIEVRVDEMLCGLSGAGEIELVRDFASPLPVMVIAEMLGIPGRDHERFRHWSNESVRMLGDKTNEDRRRAWRALGELGEYLEGVAEERRRAPQDDLLSGLVAAEEAGDRLTRRELVATCVLLLVAGNETTTNLIGNALLALLRHPEQLALLREEPKRMAGALEELLRYDSPVQLTSRMVLEDGEFAGRELRRGQQLVLLLGAANRDPARFEDPDRLDLSRDDVRHLSFGHGIHHCLGAQLARLEGQLALAGLLTRFPKLRASSDAVEWGDNTILRGPRSLRLAL